MSYTIVISHYNEDLDWTNGMDKSNLVIYNKGNDVIPFTITRKNVGRESETFLYHIVEHYHSLPDYLILLQGHPFDHMNNDINGQNINIRINEIIQRGVNDITPLFTSLSVEHIDCYPPLKVRQYFSMFFGGNTSESVPFSPGCQYIIPKQNILSRPLEFYKKLHQMAYNSPQSFTSTFTHFENYPFDNSYICPWVVERLFMFMFSSNVPLKKN
jgi:hypothetical protein